MADFSKEYCDKYMPGFPHDFSIEEEFKGIPEDHFKPIICEGYGFYGISNRKGECYILFVKPGRENVTEIPIDILDDYYKKFINQQS